MIDQIKEIAEAVVLVVSGIEALLKIKRLADRAIKKLRKLWKGGKHSRK